MTLKRSAHSKLPQSAAPAIPANTDAVAQSPKKARTRGSDDDARRHASDKKNSIGKADHDYVRSAFIQQKHQLPSRSPTPPMVAGGNRSHIARHLSVGPGYQPTAYGFDLAWDTFCSSSEDIFQKFLHMANSFNTAEENRAVLKDELLKWVAHDDTKYLETINAFRAMPALTELSQIDELQANEKHWSQNWEQFCSSRGKLNDWLQPALTAIHGARNDIRFRLKIFLKGLKDFEHMNAKNKVHADKIRQSIMARLKE